MREDEASLSVCWIIWSRLTCCEASSSLPEGAFGEPLPLPLLGPPRPRSVKRFGIEGAGSAILSSTLYPQAISTKMRRQRHARRQDFGAERPKFERPEGSSAWKLNLYQSRPSKRILLHPSHVPLFATRLASWLTKRTGARWLAYGACGRRPNRWSTTA